MGPGRARTAAVGLVAIAALVAGCGESRHANEQRPQVSRRVSVTISPKEVIVQPTKVAFGPEPHQQIPQNQDHPQPPIKTREPLDVTFVVANQTSRDTTVQILKQSQELKSEKIFAHSPGTFGASLATGTYTVSAAGSQKPARITVGAFRASSQNDVLLP
jgi:hypothetical protein